MNGCTAAAHIWAGQKARWDMIAGERHGWKRSVAKKKKSVTFDGEKHKRTHFCTTRLFPVRGDKNKRGFIRRPPNHTISAAKRVFDRESLQTNKTSDPE